MHPLLGINEFEIKMRRQLMGHRHHYDVCDSSSGKVLMTGEEQELDTFMRIGRMVLGMIPYFAFQRLVPFHIELKTAAKFNVLEISNRFALRGPQTEVKDERGEFAGFLGQDIRQLVFPTAREADEKPDEGFEYHSGQALCEVLDFAQRPLATLSLQAVFGQRFESVFELSTEEGELASVRPAFSLRELIDTGRNYSLAIKADLDPEDPLRALALASVIWLDMVYFR